MTGGSRNRRRALAGAAALSAAGLGIISNVATGLLPDGWGWQHHRTAVWSAVGALIVAVVVSAVVQERLLGTGGPGDGSGSGLRVFGAIPRPPAHFQARKPEFDALRESLGAKGLAALVALPGQRGAGKSQLAAAYARECVARGYDLVAWINAESGPVADLARLAGYLGADDGLQTPESLASAAVTWLQNQDSGRRLLVFDNVDDPDAVVPFVPCTGTTKVLVTTNRLEFAQVAGFCQVQVGMFNPQQGTVFLRAATGLPAGLDAYRVGVELGWLPLGLAQAGAYIAANGCSYTQYLHDLLKQDLDETLRRRSGTDHPGVLKATALSVASLARDDPSGDAQRVLGVVALLSPDGVSRDLLHRGSAALGLAGGVGRALDVLTSASLITLNGDGNDARDHDTAVVAVHRLTARTIRHLYHRPDATITLSDSITAATGLLDLLTGGLPFARLVHRRADFNEIVNHVTTLRGHVDTPDMLLLRQTCWTGEALHEAGDLIRAVPRLEIAATDCVRLLGADDPGTLATHHSLGIAYWSAGRLTHAVATYAQVLAARERVLGADHPDTLATGSILAAAYLSAGRVPEALHLSTQILADRERVLGADHPDTVATRGIAATANLSAGRLATALGLGTQVLADRQRLLGADHPDTLTIRHSLAAAYLSAGRVTKALDLYTQVLADRKRILGTDHPDTLATHHHLGMAHWSAGRAKEALTFYTQVLTDRERILGTDHPDTVAIRHSLAAAYLSAGRVVEALDLYTLVLADRERLLGTDHEGTLATRHNLDIAHQKAAAATHT